MAQHANTGIILGIFGDEETGMKNAIGSLLLTGSGYGRLWNERAMLKEERRQIFAEKWLLNGRIPQDIAGAGEVEEFGED